MSDISTIRLRYFNVFSRSLWLQAAESNKPRVLQVQMRSTFDGRWRHVGATASCANRLEILKTSAFHRLSSRWTPGKLKTASVPRVQSEGTQPPGPGVPPGHKVEGKSTHESRGASKTFYTRGAGPEVHWKHRTKGARRRTGELIKPKETKKGGADKPEEK